MSDWDDTGSSSAPDADVVAARKWDEDEDEGEDVAESWDADSDDEAKKKDDAVSTPVDKEAAAAAEAARKAEQKAKMPKRRQQILEEQKKMAAAKAAAAAEAASQPVNKKSQEEIEAMARERDLMLSGDLLGIDRDTLKQQAEEKMKAEKEAAMAKKKAAEEAATIAANSSSASSASKLASSPSSSPSPSPSPGVASSSSPSSSAAAAASPLPIGGGLAGFNTIETFPLRDDEAYDRFVDIISKRLNHEGNSGLAAQRLVRFIKALTTKVVDSMRLDDLAELKRFTTSIHNERTEKMKNKKKVPTATQKTTMKTLKVAAESVDRNNIGYEDGSGGAGYDAADDFM